MNLLNGLRWLRNGFIGFLDWTPTANRTINLPDDSGQVAVIDVATQTFSSSVRFNKIINSYSTQTVSGAITFTIAAGIKTPGSKTYYTLIANGSNIPDISAFIESAESLGYDGRNGVINYFEFYFDGARHLVKIWQNKAISQELTSIGLTFPNRTGASISQTNQVYTSMGSLNFDAFMSSAEAIPANKAGRITVRLNRPVLIALCDTNVAESYTSNNLEYYAWTNTDGFIYSASLTTGSSIINSGVVATDLGYLRMTRSSLGVVTCEASQNGSNWTLVRTFANTNLAPLYVTVNLSGGKTVDILSFEVAA